MESDNSDNIEERDQFANHGGDALNFDADGLQDSEDVDEEEDEDPQENMRQEQRKAEGSGQKANVKGEKLDLVEGVYVIADNRNMEHNINIYTGELEDFCEECLSSCDPLMKDEMWSEEAILFLDDEEDQVLLDAVDLDELDIQEVL